MTKRLRVLIVHNVENIRSARRSTMDYIHAFERYAPEHDYVYHRIQLPVTQVLRETAWDAVIFDSTSLGVVTIRPRERFHRMREEWAFLRDHPAVKIAFPQDDASHSALYDYWLHWMRTDVVFTVRPEKVERLYPLTRRRAAFVSTIAGFIDDQSLDGLAAMARPWGERDYVIGQRVTRYPAWGGRFAQRKSDIVIRLGEECARRGLPINISTSPQDVLHGDEWFGFLGNCRFVAGAEGGHGLCDPFGAIQDSVNDYVARHPGASFEEIEQSCFDGIDGQELFPGFAPRVLEAALMGCGQILLAGRYRDFIRPGEHYIEVREDYGNLDDVFAQMANPDIVNTMIANCTRDLVRNPAFRFSTLVADVITQIGRHHRKPDPRHVDSKSPAEIRRQHFAEMRDALTTIGLEREQLYEPYLTAWIMRELSGQLRHEDEAADLGIALPGGEQPAPAAMGVAVADTALTHACAVVASLPPDKDAIPKLFAAVRSGIGRDAAFGKEQLRELLAILGFAGDMKALVGLSQTAPDDMPGIARQLDWPAYVVRVLEGMSSHGVVPADAADLTPVQQVLAALGIDSHDAYAVARALPWPATLQKAILDLQDTGLGKDHPNSAYVLGVLRLLAHDGLSARVIKLLARHAERQARRHNG